MARRFSRLWVLVLLAVGLTGCGFGPNSGDPAALRTQAQADLTRWADAVAAGGGQSTFVPVGELTAMIGDDWGPTNGNDGKMAWMCGLFAVAVPLPTTAPPDGQVRWQDGSTQTVRLMSAQEALAGLKSDGGGPCPGTPPLQITAATQATGQVQTSRGLAAVPVWEFAFQDTPVRLARVAVTGSVVTRPWDSGNAYVGISIQSATGKTGGQELTVTFEGAPGTRDEGCGADYTAEAIESSLAVVVIVIEHAHNAFPFGESCTAVGAIRTATAQLATPLGQRVVLEVKQGRPVSVVLTP